MDALLAAVLVAAAAASPPPLPAPPDEELEILAQSLSQRSLVDKALPGGLAGLPRYRLDLELDPAARTLRGVLQLVVPPSPEGWSELWLRIPANASWLDRGTGRAVTVAASMRGEKAQALQSQENGVYRAILEPPAAAGEPVELRFDLQVAIPSLEEEGGDSAEAQLMKQAFQLVSGGGSDAKSDNGMLGCGKSSCNLWGFYPELSRREGGIWDNAAEAGVGEPRWGPLGNYLVSVVAPQSFRLAGTGAEIGRAPEKDGRVRSTRVAAAVRGVALFAGSSWGEQKVTAGAVKVRALADPAHGLQAKKTLDVATRALKLFTDRFGPYPWTDLEIVEAPLTGGVETVSFPGVVAVSAMLLSPESSPSLLSSMPRPDQLVDTVIEMSVSHHVAHQWWRGMVGSDGRERPVLDEPLSSWSSIYYVEQRRGAEAVSRAIDLEVKNAYRLARMMGRPDAAVDRPMNEYSGRAEVEALLRGKGVMYYVALRKLVGEAAFFTALKQHCLKNRFREVETDGVLLGVAATAPAKADAALKLYEHYMRQTHGDKDLGATIDMESAARAQGVQIDPATMAAIRQMMGGMSPPGGPSGAIPIAPPTTPPPVAPAPVPPKAPPPKPGP